MLRKRRVIVPMLCIGLAASWTANQVRATSISFAEAVLALEPVSYWRLGELSGDTAFDETGVSNGTYNDVVTGLPGSVINDADTSAQFWDTSPAFLEIPHSDQYLLDNGTVLFNFLDDGSIHDTGLFSKDSSGRDEGGHLHIGTTPDGRVDVRLQRTDGDFTLESSPFIELDTWYQVAFTFGDEGMKLYIDGVLVDTDPYTGGTGGTSGGTGNTEPIVVGASGAFSDPNGQVFPVAQYFSGLMDEVVIFGNALTAEQIAELHTIKVVPEPATAGLMIAGVFALLRPRRRKGAQGPML